MSLRLSTALRNHVNSGGSLRRALNGGKIVFFNGTIPANADAAESGTPLVTFTKNGSAHTAEVQATSTSVLTGGTAGSITGFLAGGIDILNGTVSFNSSLTQTAADLATAINRSITNMGYSAASSGTNMILTAPRGVGAAINTIVTTATPATITMTHGTFGGGTTAVNGLTWDPSSSGTMTKCGTETWQGTASADGTAAHFRWKGAISDAGSADSSATYIRMDGTIAASGGDLNGSTAIVNGAVQTITADQFSIPAS